MAERKVFTPEQKVAIVRAHLIEKVPVSEVCEKHGVSVVNYYNWQKQLFENAAAAFERALQLHVYVCTNARLRDVKTRSTGTGPGHSGQQLATSAFALTRIPSSRLMTAGPSSA